MIKKILKEILGIVKYTDTRFKLKYFFLLTFSIPSILRNRNLNFLKTAFKKDYLSIRKKENRLCFSGKYINGIREILFREVYFQFFDISPGDTIFDLGSNVGIFTTYAAKIAKKVISIEAQSEFIPLIEQNLNLNSVTKNVVLIHGIIGSNSGVFSSKKNRLNASHYLLDPKEYEMEAIIKENNIKSIDFIKIDIEGGEFDLFSKNYSWLDITKKLVLEIHLEFGNVSTITNTLNEKGFTVTLVNNNGSLVSNLSEDSGYIFAVKV